MITARLIPPARRLQGRASLKAKRLSVTGSIRYQKSRRRITGFMELSRVCLRFHGAYVRTVNNGLA